VRAFAAALTAERGVRHGSLNVVAVEVDRGSHDHGYAPRGKVASHSHFKPRS
jgi:CopG family nickel-responsive transcriptional regulator